MGIYIKGVAIPTNCTDCRYMPLVGCNPYQDNGMSPSHYRHRTCPLTEVAEPHGRLVDVDMAYQETMVYGEHFRKSVLKVIGNLPTIIERSTGENEK